MSFNLWLSQPETERKLSACLRVVVAVVILWALAAAYGLWSAHAALADAQLSILTQSRQLSQIAQDLPAKRRLAAQVAGVKFVSPQGAGSAEITGVLAGLAHGAGAEVGGIRMGNGGQKTGAQAGTNTGTAAPTGQAVSASGDWDQETFECTLTGEYDSLMRFLTGLADSPYLLDIGSIQILQVDANARANAPHLEMKISGIVYESSDKT